jgi:hypothetical protein
MAFLAGAAVANHQAHTNLEVLARGQFTEFEHTLRGRPVDGHGLLHKRMQAPIDGVLEVDPAESGWRPEDHDAAGLQGVHRILIGVEAEEAALRRNVDFRAELSLQPVVVVVQFLGDDVGDGDEFGRPILDGKGLARGASTAASRADQRDFDGAGYGGVHMRQGDAGKRGNTGDARGRLG